MRSARTAAARAGLALVALAALGGCGDAPAPAASPTASPAPAPPASPAAAAASAPTGFRHDVAGRPGPDGVPWRFTLVADAPPGADGLLAVRALEVRRADTPEPVQRIDGLDTRTPAAADATGLEQPDMDFDGLPDLRLQADVPAGPNVPYRHWLYDRGRARFEASAALDALTSPTFDAATREVVDAWRDGPARYGTDRYAWREGRLVGLARETREAVKPGIWTVRTYRAAADGGWVLERTREVRER